MEVELDTHIVDGLRHFMDYHKTSGTIPLEQRNALDSVQVAACFADPKNLSTKMISQRLGVRWETMEKSRQYAVTTQESEKKFSFVERKVRKDCYRDEAALCVDVFCHSEEGSRVDTESKRVYKIKNPATCTVESHPARVWNEATNGDRHEAFLMSETYRDFQQNNGEDKTIGIQRF
jgi:hypothetical protein